MEYPILIEGQAVGTLTETAEGLYTVFRADCALRAGLIRLWLHGGGRSAPLGLLAPCGGCLALTRRLSRRERQALPVPIEEVSDRPAPSAGPARSPARMPPPAPERPAPPADAEAWTPLPDGSLIADGRIALPACLSPSSPLAGRVQRIGGREYLVFRL